MNAQDLFEVKVGDFTCTAVCPDKDLRKDLLHVSMLDHSDGKVRHKTVPLDWVREHAANPAYRAGYYAATPFPFPFSTYAARTFALAFYYNEVDLLREACCSKSEVQRYEEHAAREQAPEEAKAEKIEPEPAVDKCRYAVPVLIELDGEQVTVEISKSAMPHDRDKTWKHSTASSTVGKYVEMPIPPPPFAQQMNHIDALLNGLKDKARQRIARLAKWPYCGCTQRNVSVIWRENRAYWLCEECSK